MTIITLSTVGFGEVRPLTDEGRMFTSILIISSFGAFAYSISVISQSVFTGELARFFKSYRLNNNIQNLSSHVIICGFGRNGRRAAKKLEAYGEKFIVIENNEEIISTFLAESGISFHSWRCHF